ncbi:TonB-dependent receptor [Algibacter sp. 2305UL17-15]|uniref:SusC/RagA family TonB-linked outer membrane protein n=1 Tax=Algibacter sp. 2305UL17-15 TaxID=3231268 RepID=UPI00345841AB
MMKNQLLLKLTCMVFVLLAFTGFAQNKKITGTVTDRSNMPLPGVNVIVKGTSNGASTDFDGNYSITTTTGQTLVFSYVGFKTKEVVVGNTTTYNVSLETDNAQLDEVIIVGYGTQKRSDVTGSVASISQERLEEKPNTNFAQALQGALPGITINQNSSSAEQNDVSILIRGRNSINASNSPLIVYDGIPYSGTLADINPNDIKSISVLKDASATAIYGSRGANGVILIDTKKGKRGKPKISFSSYSGYNEIANIPEIYDGQGFAAFKETREPNELTSSEIDKLIAGEYTDWLDLATRTGFKQDHNLSVSGATDRTNYYVSAGYQDVKGIAINDEFKRGSLRANVNIDITDDLKFGSSTQLTRIDRSGLSPSFGSESAGAYFTNPLTSAYDEQGNLTVNPWPEDEFFENPLGPTLADNTDISFKIFTANFIEYKFPFIKGLSFRLNTGVEYNSRNESRYWGLNTARGFRSNGEARLENWVSSNFLLENILNYNRTFGDHTIAFTGLYSSQKNEYESNRTTGVGFQSDLLTHYQLEQALSLTHRTIFEQTTLVSQMGRLNYNYKSKYFATFTVRRDGFSGFGDDEKYGVFPSVALGWKVSEESFFPKEGIVNNLKLRFSYGENGNQAVGPYDNLSRLTDRSYLNFEETAPGFIPSQLANNGLSWETTATYNLGVDLGILKNRFNLSIDAYRARTSDLLLDRLIPSVHGITEVTQNIGETQNQGIEIALGGAIVDAKNFNWKASGNFSYNENEIVSLFASDQDDIANGLFIGQPISSNYGFKFDGIWQQNDDIANSAQPGAVPGDVRVLDVNNPVDDAGNPILGISANDDRVIQGQRDPKVIWGLDNTFTYKNVSLNIFMHGVGGVTKRNTTKDENVFGGVRRNWYVLDYWTPDNPINTFHRNHQDANINNVGFFEKADFIRIKDISLSYKFNESLFGDSNGSLKLYFTARNLFTITDWDGLDPELNSQRSVPLQKEFILGLNLTL